MRAAVPFAWSALVFSLGFFALAVQAPLFRTYLASFDGSELGVGGFFGSWLGAVALGAMSGRAVPRGGTLRSGAFALLSLLYLPALLLHHLLVADVRRLAGVAPWEAFPLGTMLAVSLPANAPVGLVTGFLFTAACRSAPAEAGLPVARVYVLEALGGAAGGAASALLLRGGAASETVFFVAALLPAGSAALLHGGRRPAARGTALLGLPLLLAVGLLLGLDRRWAEANRRAAWSRLLPGEGYRGSLATTEGVRSYGERQGQFLVVSLGGVVEALPDAERASEVLAAHLAQRPEARRVLVAGEGGLALALRFTELPQIARIVWLHPDPDYPRALRSVLPERFRIPASRVEMPGRDLRRFLRESPGTFDLILLSLPDVTTLALNRYATREFFSLLKGALAPGGVASVRISGGENYLGGELAFLGASMLFNVEAVFRSVAIKPGGETWILASEGEGLSAAPAVLRDRFAAIPGASALYPPEGILGLYPPDRVEFQTERYRRMAAEAGEKVLANTDRHPKALLYGLAAGLRRGGIPMARHLPLLLDSLFGIAAGGILLYGVLRGLYLAFGGPGPGRPRAFDAVVLVLTTGAAGMGVSVVLLFLYQSQHGSLALDVGLLSALFMLGLCLGGGGAARLLARGIRGPGFLTAAGTAAVLAAALLVRAIPAEVPRWGFAALFLLSGGAMGLFFPAAAGRMAEAGWGTAAAGAILETADHLGGAAGAVLGAVAILPVCGIGPSLGLVALLAVVNLLPLAASRRGRGPAEGDGFDRVLRAAAYGGLGLAGFLLWASQVVSWAGTGREGQLLEAAARRLASPAEVEPRTAARSDGTSFPYFAVRGGGYVFRTGPLAAGVDGYGGPIDLAVRVDEAGVLLGTEVLRSSETPAYLGMTDAWRKGLEGRNLFGTGPFAGVDGVTGATITSTAVLRTLERAGRAFAAEILGRPVDGREGPAADSRWEGRGVFLAALAAAAILVRYRPRRWLRRAVLAAALLGAGLWLNLQYSTHQVFSFLVLGLPSPGLTAAFFLAGAVPLLVAFFGNIYCGWMCPFGALQELAGEAKGRLPSDPGRRVWRWGRAVKYVLLGLLGAAFALTRDPAVLGADPLLTIFSTVRRGIQDGWAFGLGVGGVLLAVIFRRFWCRNLCPAGAFLSLVGGLRLLRKIVPAARPGRCDMGVRGPRELDCLCCDRCRHETD